MKERPKILCLGVSYPCIEANLREKRLSTSVGVALEGSTTKLSVDTTIQCVQEKILTQMDARDLARCQATEDHCNVDMYCVSQEKGAKYRPDRHFDANFNGRTFVKELQTHFEGCQFDQIVLDYFWIPTGWDRNHWSRSFFEDTLIGFARTQLLRIVPSRQLFHRKHQRGVIYLPFCFHCFKEVVAAFDKLKRYYNVSFLRTNELEKCALWSGTQTIDAHTMQTIFGKQLNQEEKYCTFTPLHMKGMGEDPAVSREELVRVANSLEDFPDIRFIVLEPLPSLLRKTRNRKATGRFLGLMSPSKVQRGFSSSRNSAPTTSPSSTTTTTFVLTRASTIQSASRKRKRPVVTPSEEVEQQRRQPKRMQAQKRVNGMKFGCVFDSSPDVATDDSSFVQDLECIPTHRSLFGGQT